MRTLSLALIASSAVALAQANVVTKEGTGEAAVINKDEGRAFEEAKGAALRAAVEQAAGVRVDADTLVVNNQLVRDQVFANTGGYVKSFDVVSKKVEKNVMTVTVKANVITDNLDKDIQAARDLVKRMGRPSIVIVIQEQTIPIGDKTTLNSEVTATVLTEAFKADGWEIKDPQAVNKSLKLDPSVGAAGAKAVGDLTKANYVLYGTTSLRHAEPDSLLKGSSIYPVSGEYNLAIAATDSELQLAKVAGKLEWKMDSKVSPTVSYERTAFGLIQERKREIIDSVRKGVLEHFRSETMNGKRISVAVSGLDSFGAAKDFKKSIEAIKGIKEATQDTFANGKATFRVVYAGTVDDLASEVEAATFKKKKLNIVSATGNTLEVNVAK
ncbi:MAG: flagellar assembly protein T N-terminal domain-containing protein [Myxococcaceae bacterium]|nr:flagellar assembly protein T N-terminal domain-containing protein [Myxococcaceae bacterium]